MAPFWGQNLYPRDFTIFVDAFLLYIKMHSVFVADIYAGLKKMILENWSPFWPHP
jgi:hypothetical protein